MGVAQYAKSRPQGRPTGVGGKDARAAAAHHRAPDVADAAGARAYARRACPQLYCARLVDEQRRAGGFKEEAALLELLTPIAKSWPSEFCWRPTAGHQVHGYGYTRDFAVEQHWRDNRLNMIHEGTHGIQALDLLGRKVVMQERVGLAPLASRIDDTITRARPVAGLAEHADALASALAHVTDATRAAWATGDPEAALANATPYLQAFGHMVLAWIWLDVAVSAAAQANKTPDDPLPRGLLAACRYFFRYELPRIGPWLKVVETRDDTCRTMAEEWF